MMSHLMEEGGCCVCSESTAEGENVIVYCDGPGCNLGTHKACYGITEIPKDDWYCQRCQYESKGHKVICELCPFRDGAFKMTNKGRWCHVICALYIPEATFLDTRRMESVNLDLIPGDRFQKICYVCEDKGKESKKYGACIPCSFLQCKFSFHVTCGHLEGLLVENVSRNSKIDYQGYCKMHIKSICKNQGIKPIARYNVKRIRHASQSSSATSGSQDSPDKEGPPLLKPEVPAPGVSLPPPVLCAEQLAKPPPIKKARKCSSSSSSANGRGGSSSHRKSHSGSNNGFLQNILSGAQGGAAARSASALLTASGDARPQLSRNFHRPHFPSPLDAMELLGIGQPTPVAQHGLQTMEQLLEWQWNEGGQMLMQTADRGLAGSDSVDTADIVSLLSCLHELKAQNERLQRQVLEMENKKGHLSHVTARLAETLNKFGGGGGGSSSTAPVIAPSAPAPTLTHNGAATTSQVPAALTPVSSGAGATRIVASTSPGQAGVSAAPTVSAAPQLPAVIPSQQMPVPHAPPPSRAPELHPSAISSANTAGLESGRRSMSLISPSTSGVCSNGTVGLLVTSASSSAVGPGPQLPCPVGAALPVIGSDAASIAVPHVRYACLLTTLPSHVSAPSPLHAPLHHCDATVRPLRTQRHDRFRSGSGNSRGDVMADA